MLRRTVYDLDSVEVRHADLVSTQTDQLAVLLVQLDHPPMHVALAGVVNEP